MEERNRSKREVQEVVNDPESLVNVAELGAFIKRKREGERLSLRAVAKQTQVSASTLSRIENSTGTPDAETLARLAKWLNLPLDRIIGLQASIENSFAQLVPGYTPDVVEAHLRADVNLTPENAAALSELFRLAYKQYSVKK
ncbi:MAG: helix-turn-helix domain-containing protein [Acidobacteria bacterium]|nr:helix-turn-helix domain-containing protein [Acidobacteriota bacterium]